MRWSRPPLLHLALLSLCLCSAPAAAQQVYKWVDEHGQVQFTQTPPPNQTDFETRDMAAQTVSDELRQYCAAIAGLAREVAAAAARGVPITSVSDGLGQVEEAHDVDVDQIAMRELVNYVYSNVSRGRYDATVAGRAQAACLNGSFGKRGQTRQSTADGDDGRRGASSGTGWISRGVIVTNHHVIEGRRRLKVRLTDGSERPARLLASDADDDVALLSVQGDLPDGLPIAQTEVEIGTDVFTLGYPHTQIMGSNAKLTSGIVNATTGMRDDPRFYQISVAVQSGNSGGPLINLDG
jgi:S1-C subfamily serine protease